MFHELKFPCGQGIDAPVDSLVSEEVFLLLERLAMLTMNIHCYTLTSPLCLSTLQPYEFPLLFQLLLTPSLPVHSFEICTSSTL